MRCQIAYLLPLSRTQVWNKRRLENSYEGQLHFHECPVVHLDKLDNREANSSADGKNIAGPSKNGIDNPLNKLLCSKAQKKNPMPFFGEVPIGARWWAKANSGENGESVGVRQNFTPICVRVVWFLGRV